MKKLYIEILLFLQNSETLSITCLEIANFCLLAVQETWLEDSAEKHGIVASSGTVLKTSAQYFLSFSKRGLFKYSCSFFI